MTDRPDLFSKSNPNLQLAWDATSIAAYMECPWRYHQKIILGRHPKVPPAALVYGTIWHEAVGLYDRLRFEGKPLDEALETALLCAHNMAFCRDLWAGYTLDELALEGKKEDRNRRTLHTLQRALVWYSEEFSADPMKPLGAEYFEVGFTLPLPIESPYGEPYLLCGYLDSVVEFCGEVYIRERKHTTSALSSYYWRRFDPNPQIDTYALAARSIFPDLKIGGVVVEALQIGVNFARFDRRFIHRTQSQTEEWLRELCYWIKRAEADAEAGFWPRNTATTMLYGGSEFRRPMATSPEFRDGLLETDFPVGEKWNPLIPR